MIRLRSFILVSSLIAMLLAPSLAIAAQEGTPVPGNVPPVVWRSNPAANYGPFDQPAASSDTAIYVAAADGTLTAFSILDGSTLWSVSTGLTAGELQVTASDDVVAVVRGGEMNVYRAADGGFLWTRSASNEGDVFPAASFDGDLLLTNELRDDQREP
ncbi:MAG: PQQ-binding-like beta-propeller repeat protein, partial [Thermomicrobiales bacterium]